MLKDITFGQYYEGGSFIHRLDARTKIILLILNIVFLFLAGNYYSLALCSIFTAFVLTLSKVPARMFLKNIKTILPIIIFTSLLNLFYGTGGRVLFTLFWKLTVTTGGISRAVFITGRIVLLILISSLLTYTTTPNDITDAIESLLSFLRVFGLRGAVHVLAMMMTIALRFIPTLVEETEKIINAQKARGADLENGKLLDKVKALIPILIPLLISSVRRAYELAEAMESRCYNGGVGRVRMKRLRFSLRDLIAAMGNALCCGGVIALNILL